MKPTKCPAREKKMSKKSEKREEERILNVKILLSAHARTSQADTLHLDQKAVKSTTSKRVCGKF